MFLDIFSILAIFILIAVIGLAYSFSASKKQVFPSKNNFCNYRFFFSSNTIIFSLYWNWISCMDALASRVLFYAGKVTMTRYYDGCL
jgi:hypothetical protein